MAEEVVLKGSCLCGAVSYEASGNPRRFYHCHCSRCRKASGTGHASNLLLKGTIEWLTGTEHVVEYPLPTANGFKTTFCSRCGSQLPREARSHNIVVITAGSLDEDPPLQPQARIFQGSRAPWSCDGSALATFDAYPE